MTDPTYVVQSLAWLVVWSVGGIGARQYLAGKESHRRHHDGRSAR